VITDYFLNKCKVFNMIIINNEMKFFFYLSNDI